MARNVAVDVDERGAATDETFKFTTSPRLLYWPVLKPFLSWGFCFFWAPVIVAIWIMDLGLSKWVALAVLVVLLLLVCVWSNMGVLIGFLVHRNHPLEVLVSASGLQVTFEGEHLSVCLSDIASVVRRILPDGATPVAIIRLAPGVRDKIDGRWARWVELEPTEHAPRVDLGASTFPSDDTLDQILKALEDFGASISEERIERLRLFPANPPKLRFFIYAGFFNALAVASLIANLVNG